MIHTDQVCSKERKSLHAEYKEVIQNAMLNPQQVFKRRAPKSSDESEPDTKRPKLSKQQQIKLLEKKVKQLEKQKNALKQLVRGNHVITALYHCDLTLDYILQLPKESRTIERILALYDDFFSQFEQQFKARSYVTAIPFLLQITWWLVANVKQLLLWDREDELKDVLKELAACWLKSIKSSKAKREIIECDALSKLKDADFMLFLCEWEENTFSDIVSELEEST